MPNLATREDFAKLKQMIETESWRIRFWVGGIVVATSIAIISIVAALKA